MNQRSRLVFLSSIAAPHQVKFCYALQEYFDAEFWFYEAPDRIRGSWWRVELGKRCKILRNVHFLKSGPWSARYFVSQLTEELTKFNPDIVMLGGFSIPSNFHAYRWAKKNGKRTIVFTERSRNSNGQLRKRGLGWRLLHRLYRDVDLVMTSADDAVEQFREFGFGEKVIASRYAADLDAYFTHPLRRAKPAYTYLFANRLMEIYNPLGALEIFKQILTRYPGSRLLMNARGELGDECRATISEWEIGEAVEFLDNIRSWDELHTVYARSDILVLPATFSNGNFTILEAMASGMGLVVSDRVLGIGKMVQDNVNGFNCEPSAATFVDRIERYILQPELLTNHAALNRPIVEPLSVGGTARVFAEAVRQRLSGHPGCDIVE